MKSYQTMALVALAAGSTQAAPYNDFFKRQTSGLNSAIVAAGKLYFGTATETFTLKDAEYATQVSNTADFGQLSPANSMKWQSVQPTQDTFTFAGGDAIADLAEANGQLLRCHTLVWYNQLPTWVSGGGFDNATLIEVMINHITATVTQWKGKCYAWDVVNEAISDNGDGSFRSNVFLDTIGEAYIPIAFAAAAAADPDAKLYYNDYSIESDSPKATAALNIVKLVQSYGAKIDGIGLQAHFIVGSTPSTEAQVANMEAFAALGVEVGITELDIRTDTPVTASAQTQQAADYASTIDACMQVDACVGITLWDWTDKYSWVPGTFAGEGSALPWDEDLQKKEDVYDAMIAAIGGSTSGNVTASATATAAPTSSATLTVEVDPVTLVTSSTASETSSSEAAPVTTAAPTTAPPSAPDSSFTTFTTLCTESANGTTYTTIHTHSAPIYSNSTMVGPIATGTGIIVPTTNGTIVAPVTTVPLPTSEPKCEVEYVYV
ncbi:hypothetical protein LTR17_009743 [Elasticomyces elasticus]|nr:hypothetical protein LTR17_009743 [Elasticomyces elasticus]